MNKNLARIVLLTAGLLWGAGFLVNKLVLDSGWNESQLLFVRFFTAFVVMGAIYNKRIRTYFKNNSDDYSLLKKGLLLGVLLFLGFYFQTLGLVYTTPSNNALITAGYIILLPIVIYVFDREIVAKKTIVAGLITLIGIVVLSVDFSKITNVNIGDIITFIATIFYAVHIYYLGKLTKRVDLFLLTIFQFLMFSILAYIMMMLKGGFPQIDYSSMNGMRFLIYAVTIGVFGSFLGFLFQSIGQKHTSEAEAAILIASESLFGPLLSILFYGDLITINLIIGMTLIISGIVLSEIDASKITKKMRKFDRINN